MDSSHFMGAGTAHLEDVDIVSASIDWPTAIRSSTAMAQSRMSRAGRAGEGQHYPLRRPEWRSARQEEVMRHHGRSFFQIMT